MVYLIYFENIVKSVYSRQTAHPRTVLEIGIIHSPIRPISDLRMGYGFRATIDH